MEGLRYKTQVKGESTYCLYDSENLLYADVKFGSAVRYDPFGILTSETGDASNRLTYTGQQYDRQTGQYYLRARYYNPVIGRFTQQDTYRGDGLNLYAYCANNPKDARYGNGQYLSDIKPDTETSVSLAKKFINVPNKYKYTHYVEIDVTDLNVIQGRGGVFVIPNEFALDLTGRIVSTGMAGKRL